MVSGSEAQPSSITQAAEERIRVAIYPEQPEQTIAIGSTQTKEGRKALCELLRRNLDVFAWKPEDMTAPRDILLLQNALWSEECWSNLSMIGRQSIPKANRQEFRSIRGRSEEGIFLGYKVNTKGFKVWPDKVDVVLALPSLKCLKDVQKLNGKLGSLNRFLAKSAEKSLPFFKTLKKCTKKSDFHWTTEVEDAFKQMKKLIAELPTLTTPKEKEELIVYLAAAKETVSAILMTERETKQMPIYFVSHALQSPEINYTPIEKLVLDLVLSKPEITGRMQKWSIELGEYDIQYRFDATNNKAEYEALIAGLRIAEQMGVKNLQTNVDSRLVANQVNGSYIAKESGMVRYLEKVKALASSFKKFSIQNMCPD
ncbi:reverse transcriptase domain-containing protein [Tanacetum coccineum]